MDIRNSHMDSPVQEALKLRGKLLTGYLEQRFAEISDMDAIDGDYRLNTEFRDRLISSAKKPAAVLITLVERKEGISLILTKRTEKLKSHSGQIALPGGKIDASDIDAKHTALRESEEEIGLLPGHVNIVGQLPDYITGSGFRISPVVGVVPKPVLLIPNPDEVEEIFEVPLEYMMNQYNHIIGSRIYEGSERFYYEVYWQHYKIWGVTAGILRVFQERMFP